MSNLLCRVWQPVLVLATGLTLGWTALIAVQAGESGASKANKELEGHLHASLRIVINQGADLYNLNQDYAGCYHTFKGSLVTVRPLLSDHPDLQKLIDQSLSDADTKAKMWDRAFVLRHALESIRAKLDPDAGKKNGEKKGVAKKGDEKKDDSMARVWGKVTYKGKPVTAGFVTFVAKDGRTYSANLSEKGEYKLKKHGLPAIQEGKNGKKGEEGVEYIVIIEAPVSGDLKSWPVPERYRSPKTSKLSFILEPKEEKIDLLLD